MCRAIFLTLLVLVGCVPPRPMLPPPVSWPGGDEPRDALRASVQDGLERLVALEHWYEWEASKNSTKARIMAVFSVAAAATAGAIAGVLSNSRIPENLRPSLGAVAVASSASSGAFTLIPVGHHYALKERGYRARAGEVRRAWAVLGPACGAVVLADPVVEKAVLLRCVVDLTAAWQENATFPDDSPCIPPESGAFARHLARGREGR